MDKETWQRPRGMNGKFHLVAGSIEPWRFKVDAFVAACGRPIYGRRLGEHWEQASDLTRTDSSQCVDCVRWAAGRARGRI